VVLVNRQRGMELSYPTNFESYGPESLSYGHGQEASNLAPETRTLLQRAETPTQSSVSRTVHPNWKLGSCNFMGIPEDVTVVSLDLIHFHVHQTCLLAASSNLFNGFMPITRGLLRQLDWDEDIEEVQGLAIINLPEVASVINILLFAVYNRIPSTSALDVSNTSLSEMRMAIVALKTYGIPIQTSVSETSLIFATFGSHCPIAALQVYTIAASNAPDLHALAVYASQFLLSLDLSTISDEVAVEMGPSYLRRLFVLHMERVHVFKQLVIVLPRPHRSSPHCDDTDGVSLKEAWAYATAYLLWSGASPSMSNSAIDNAMASVMDKIACNDCKDSMKNHCLSLKQQWSLVEKTIR